uniref:Tetraspanin n=1 Tax=Plectus sambesii TaxID=2011161 RepID=A0A914VKS9_9BILA
MANTGHLREKFGTVPIIALLIQLACFGLLIISWFGGNHEEIHAALESTTTNTFKSSLYTHFFLHRSAIIVCGAGILAYMILIMFSILSIRRNAAETTSPTSHYHRHFDTALRYGKPLVLVLAVIIQIWCSVTIICLAADELQENPQKEIEVLLRDVIVTNPAAMRALEATNRCCGVRLKTGKINYPSECLGTVSVPTCTDKVSNSLIGFVPCILLLALTLIVTAVMGIDLIRKCKLIFPINAQKPDVECNPTEMQSLTDNNQYQPAAT